MQIDELNFYTKLFDTYGKLLSAKQFEVMDKLLNYNLGESELAELESGSRQAVHDAVSKAKKQLLDFESKCGIVASKEDVKSKLLDVKVFLEKSDYENVFDKINDVLESL